MTAGYSQGAIRARLACLTMAVVGLLLVNMASANLGAIHADLIWGMEGGAVCPPTASLPEVSADAFASRAGASEAGDNIGPAVAEEASAGVGAVRAAEALSSALGLALPEPAWNVRPCLIPESDAAPSVWQASCCGVAGDGSYSAEDNPLWTLSDEIPACVLACGV